MRREKDMTQFTVSPQEWGTANTSTAVLYPNGRLEVHTGKVNTVCDANNVKSVASQIATLHDILRLRDHTIVELAKRNQNLEYDNGKLRRRQIRLTDITIELSKA
jgi:hypothetical protein